MKTIQVYVLCMLSSVYLLSCSPEDLDTTASSLEAQATGDDFVIEPDNDWD